MPKKKIWEEEERAAAEAGQTMEYGGFHERKRDYRKERPNSMSHRPRRRRRGY